VSWQDELRRLDEELAAGRISADDYRSRRDQILSTAVSPGAEPAAGASESTTMMPPVQSPGQGTQGTRGQGGDADKTQIVSGQDVGDSERTQSVGGWRATPPDDPNRTQVVPGVPPQAQGSYPPRPAPPASPPGGFQQPPWQQGEEDMAPPWAGQDFPPLAAASTPDWARQGPEVFEDEKKSSTGKVLGIIAIVVVLVGVAIGAYFMFRPDESTDANPPADENPPATSEGAPPSEEEPEGPIAELPGDRQNMSQVETFEQVKSIDYLTPQEIALYEQGGADASAVAISTEDDVRIIVLVVTMESEQAAVSTRDALNDLQLRFKLADIPAPDGVLAARNDTASSGPLTRAHYASGDSVVRIQTQGADGEAANSLFEDVLAAQLEQLPADG
jgi:hypothetical protein